MAVDGGRVMTAAVPPPAEAHEFAINAAQSMTHPRQVLCPAAVEDHPWFLVDSDESIACPWCEVDAFRDQVHEVMEALNADGDDPVSAASFTRQAADAFAAKVAGLEEDLVGARSQNDRYEGTIAELTDQRVWLSGLLRGMARRVGKVRFERRADLVAAVDGAVAAMNDALAQVAAVRALADEWERQLTATRNLRLSWLAPDVWWHPTDQLFMHADIPVNRLGGETAPDGSVLLAPPYDVAASPAAVAALLAVLDGPTEAPPPDAAAESAAVVRSGRCTCTDDEACLDHDALEVRAEQEQRTRALFVGPAGADLPAGPAEEDLPPGTQFGCRSCGHPHLLHDLEDLEDAVPRCCVEGCSCGEPFGAGATQGSGWYEDFRFANTPVSVDRAEAAEPARDDLRNRLRQALGHDELPDDDGLIADVVEWIRMARASNVPVPEGHQEPQFTPGDTARLADAWDQTADYIESHGQDDRANEQIRAGIYRSCAVSLRHLVHVPESSDRHQAPAGSVTTTPDDPTALTAAARAVLAEWSRMHPSGYLAMYPAMDTLRTALAGSVPVAPALIGTWADPGFVAHQEHRHPVDGCGYCPSEEDR